MRILMRANGDKQALPQPMTIEEIEQLIDAETVDSVMLADRFHVMILDDAGHDKALPINREATTLYWERCGGPTSHCIRGDVVICPDSDFENKH